MPDSVVQGLELLVDGLELVGAGALLAGFIFSTLPRLLASRRPGRVHALEGTEALLGSTDKTVVTGEHAGSHKYMVLNHGIGRNVGVGFELAEFANGAVRLDRDAPADNGLAANADIFANGGQVGDENVVVRKEGRSLRVVVDSYDGRVDVKIPLSTVKEFGKRLRRLSREF